MAQEFLETRISWRLQGTGVRTSTIVMIGFAVVFGLLAVFLANAWLNNRAAEEMRNLAAQRKAAPPAHTIVVASRPLKFGDVLSASALREIPWPENDLPKGAFSRISELTATKRVVLMPLAANEPILAARITGPGERATLSSLLKKDMKAVTIRVNDVNGVAGFVLPGDHVDVLLTRPGDNKVSVNDVVIQDARVLAVDQKADDTTDKPTVVKAVTLEVDETGGQKLALASMVGTLSLLLRKAGEVADDKTREVTPIDLSNNSAAMGASRSATVAVIRPTKNTTTQDEYSVPVELSKAPAVALSAQTMAHE
ncbi:MAG: Flp pilus assembly protein CpaB [Xanthobacteraceae bacterium]